MATTTKRKPAKKRPARKTKTKTKAKAKTQRPLAVLEHFYHTNARRQAKLAKLIKARGGSV